MTTRLLVIACLLLCLASTPGRAQVYINGFVADGAQAGSGSAGQANVSARLDLDEQHLSLTVKWQDLAGSQVSVFLHGPAAAGATGPLLAEVPLFHTGDQAKGVIPTTPELVALLLDGQGYVVVNTEVFPAGEVRAQLFFPWQLFSTASSVCCDAPPNLSATGSLEPGSSNALSIAINCQFSSVYLVLGVDWLGLPYKGGVLGPTPDVLVTLPAGCLDDLEVPLEVPPSAQSGLQLWAQAWCPTGGSTFAVIGGTTLLATVP